MKPLPSRFESDSEFGRRPVPLLHEVKDSTSDVPLIGTDRPLKADEYVCVLFNRATVPEVAHAGTSGVSLLNVSIELLRGDYDQLALQSQSLQ